MIQGSGRQGGSAGGRHARRLAFALGLTAAFMVVEATVGLLSGSLVLVADAAHMLTDVAALGLALGAIWFAQRPATQQKTYGYYRVEILAALVNSLLVLGVATYILYEAFGRFTEPPAVSGWPVLLVAAGGLAVNLVSAWVLLAGARESLNLRAAFVEVVGDMLGSGGAIIAGIILITTGWRYADPLVATGVALLIVPRALKLMKDALDILLEGTPAGVDFERVARAMVAVPGVERVHDLHIWSVTSGFVALSGHVLVADAGEQRRVLLDLRRVLADEFGIGHVTIQVETADVEASLGQPCLPDSGNCFGGDAGDRVVSHSSGH